MQYTGLPPTRPTTAAREQALSEGIDPNSNEWQEIYFGQSTPACTIQPKVPDRLGALRSFEDRPAGLDPAAGLPPTGPLSPEAVRGYFQAGTPHSERRQGRSAARLAA